jgi:hypothetical protein
MPYKRGQVVRLIRPITEVRVGEDHGSSVWVSCDGLSGYVRTSNIETDRPAGAQKTLTCW